MPKPKSKNSVLKVSTTSVWDEVGVNPKHKVIPLKYGATLFKNLLNEKNQKKLLDICKIMMDSQENKSLMNTNANHTAIPVLFYNWPGKPNSNETPKPEGLLKLAAEMVQPTKDTTSEPFYLSPSFNPVSAYAIMYPPGGSFKSHKDGSTGWVFAISIGDSADFFQESSPNDVSVREYITLESGDAVLFNGGNIYHGVTQILPNTAPTFWKEHPLSKYNMARFNIQFRDPNYHLTYYPQFAEYS